MAALLLRRSAFSTKPKYSGRGCGSIFGKLTPCTHCHMKQGCATGQLGAKVCSLHLRGLWWRPFQDSLIPDVDRVCRKWLILWVCSYPLRQCWSPAIHVSPHCGHAVPLVAGICSNRSCWYSLLLLSHTRKQLGRRSIPAREVQRSVGGKCSRASALAIQQ